MAAGGREAAQRTAHSLKDVAGTLGAMELQVREKLPELVEVLEEKKGVVDELASTLTIHEIEQFAGEMQALGKEYGYPPLVSCGEKLAESAGSFDMDAMAKGLEGYPNLIDAVRAASA